MRCVVAAPLRNLATYCEDVLQRVWKPHNGIVTRLERFALFPQSLEVALLLCARVLQRPHETSENVGTIDWSRPEVVSAALDQLSPRSQRLCTIAQTRSASVNTGCRTLR